MAVFQDIRRQTKQKIMVHLLSEVERNPSFTQRRLASELNIALGLMNQYLKRYINKGWIRASQMSPRRITYFLTVEGFKEKSHMVKNYLSCSMSFFRDARAQCEATFEYCKLQGWSKIALVGEGDLTDIVKLVVSESNFEIQIVSVDAEFAKYDAIMVTDLIDPQGTYDAIRCKVEYPRLLVLNLLHISKVV